MISVIPNSLVSSDSILSGHAGNTILYSLAYSAAILGNALNDAAIYSDLVLNEKLICISVPPMN